MQSLKLFLFLLELLFVALISNCSLHSSKDDRASLSPTMRNSFVPSSIWRRSIGDSVGNFYSNLHPAYADSVVYTATRKGIVKALNVNNGREIWSVNLAEKDNNWFSPYTQALLSGGVLVSDSRIYIGSERAQVYALNTNNGTVVWRSNVAGEILSSPVLSNGVVLVHTSNGQLQALYEEDGTVKWTINLDTPVLSLRGESTPSVAFGTAFIGDDSGRVSAILINQGQIIWQQRISQATGPTEIDRLSDVDITPVIVGDVVYAVAYNGNLVALDVRNGEVIWKCKIGSINDFVVDSNYIYLVDQDDRLLAVNTSSGLTLWIQSNLLHRSLTAPVFYNGSLVVGDSKGYMHWIDPESGQFIVQKKVDNSGFLAKPIIADGKLLIQAKNGTLYAIVC